MYTTIVHYPNISSNEIASISLETLVSYLRGFCLFHFTLFSQTDRNFFFFLMFVVSFYKEIIVW